MAEINVSKEMVKYAMDEILRAEGNPRLSADDYERFERRSRLGCEAVLRFIDTSEQTGDPGPMSATEREMFFGASKEKQDG